MPGNDINIRLENLNLEPAIRARRMMRFERHSFAEIGEQVYLPTRELLLKYAAKEPDTLLCVASKAAPLFPSISPGKRVNVHLVLPDKTVIHIGSVLDHRLSYDFWRWTIDNFKDNPETVERLIRTRPTAIRNESWLVLIPTSSRNLNRSVLSEAVGRYLWHTVPQLMENTPQIRWLNNTLAFSIERAIVEQAEASSTSPSSSMTLKEISQRLSKNPHE